MESIQTPLYDFIQTYGIYIAWIFVFFLGGYLLKKNVGGLQKVYSKAPLRWWALGIGLIWAIYSYEVLRLCFDSSRYGLLCSQPLLVLAALPIMVLGPFKFAAVFIGPAGILLIWLAATIEVYLIIFVVKKILKKYMGYLKNKGT